MKHVTPFAAVTLCLFASACGEESTSGPPTTADLTVCNRAAGLFGSVVDSSSNADEWFDEPFPSDLRRVMYDLRDEIIDVAEETHTSIRPHATAFEGEELPRELWRKADRLLRACEKEEIPIQP